MTPFEIEIAVNEQEAKQRDIDQQRYERYSEGATDAAFGQLPQYSDPDYLAGYVAKIRELPTDPETKRIKHYTAHQHFAFGYCDGDPSEF